VDQKKRQNIKNRRVAEATRLTLPSKAYYIWLMLLIDGFIKNQKVLNELKKNKKDFPLILTTSRVLQHYNAATMTKRTKNIKIVDEDILLIHPKDAKYRELNTGDIARLYSGRGEVSLKVEVTEKVKEGIVFTTFHFPEHMVNMVTGHGKDEETMCAEYKVSAVEVQKISNQFKTKVSTEKNQAEVKKTLRA